MFNMQDNSSKKSQIKQNILQFIEYKGITRYKFYQITGITRGVLDQNNGMNEDNITRFLDSFPEINANWLLTGKGSMLREGEVRSAEEERMALLQEVIETQRKTIELLEDRVAALEEELAQYTEEGGATAG